MVPQLVHNPGLSAQAEDPSLTQPLSQRRMKEHLPVSQQYSELLVETGISTWKSVGRSLVFLGNWNGHEWNVDDVDDGNGKRFFSSESLISSGPVLEILVQRESLDVSRIFEPLNVAAVSLAPSIR